jgi:hypothetical protein
MSDTLDLDAYRERNRQVKKSLDPKQRYQVVLEEVDRQLAQYKKGPSWWKMLVVGLVSMGLVSLFTVPLMFLMQSLKVNGIPWQLGLVFLSFIIVFSIAAVTLGNFLVEANLRRARLIQIKLALLSILRLRVSPPNSSFDEWRQEAIVCLLEIVPGMSSVVLQRMKENQAQKL